MRTLLGRIFVFAVAVSAIACEAVLDLSSYQSGSGAPDSGPEAASGCPAGEKQCMNSMGAVECVSTNSPLYGCGSTTCLSCTELATPHTAATLYACSGSGSCLVELCPAGWQNCDTTKSYCESNLNNDDKNCGDCFTTGNGSNMGADCTAIPLTHDATAIHCVSALCKITSCQPGFADCNGVPTDGCEVQLGANNCWSCPVASATAACPCKQCYAGPGGIPGVCPACNASMQLSTATCNMTAQQCQ